MSSNLGWLPITPNKHKWLSTDLKFAMRKKYGPTVNTVLNSSDIPYLEGLRDAGIDDANKLIQAIEHHTEILLEEIY